MTTTVEIEPKLFKTITKMAKKENTTEKKIINKMIEKGIEDSQTKPVPDFFDLGGKFTTDEPFDVVEYRRKMRNGEI